MGVPRGSVGKPQRGTDPPRDLPAILLGRLAVASHLQNPSVGLGTNLMRDAVVRTVMVSSHIGVRLMVVDALNEDLVGWYERFGFDRIRSDPLRLVAVTPSLRRTYQEFGGEIPEA
jgi:predicted N-acetyltransferase YhbS